MSTPNPTPAEPKHDDYCDEWCNHCIVCGTGTLYGSLCSDHRSNPTPLGTTDGKAKERWRFVGRDKRGLLVWSQVRDGNQRIWTSRPHLFWNKRRRTIQRELATAVERGAE